MKKGKAGGSHSHNNSRDVSPSPLPLDAAAERRERDWTVIEREESWTSVAAAILKLPH